MVDQAEKGGNNSRELEQLKILRDEGLKLLATFKTIDDPKHRALVIALVEALAHPEA